MKLKLTKKTKFISMGLLFLSFGIISTTSVLSISALPSALVLQNQQETYQVQKLSEYSIFAPGYKKSHSYRIPSIVKTKNKLLSVVDQRLTSQLDSPYTDIKQFLRTSSNNGNAWDEGRVILNVKNKSKNVTGAIDSTLIYDDKDNSVYMAIDVFTGGSGLMHIAQEMNPLSGNDMGYTPNNKYQKFFVLNDNSKYVLKEVQKQKNNIWYRVHKLKDSNWNNTNDSNLEAKNIFANQVYNPKTGDLTFEAYENITSITQANFNNGISLFDGFLNKDQNYTKPKFYISSAAYIYLIKSTDEGLTWSLVDNITNQVKSNQSNINSIVLGPGQGLVLKNQADKTKNGRMLLPIYGVHNATPTNAYPAYSDDKGITWTKANPHNYWGRYANKKEWRWASETQMIEAKNGTIYAFSRTNEFNKYYVSKSLDGGENWISDNNDPTKTIATYSYANLNSKIMHGIVNFEFKGNEYTLLSLPTTTQRVEGKLFLIKNNNNAHLHKIYDFNAKGSLDNSFGYSAMVVLDKTNDYVDIGILLEKQANSSVFAADKETIANKFSQGLIFQKLRIRIS